MRRKQPAADPAGSLEARLARLDAIVSTLEGRDLELEEALRLFEEGVGHIRQAQEAIRVAELRIERLVELPGGDVGTEPVSGGDAE